MSWLKVSEPKANQNVSDLGFTVSGEAEGALVPSVTHVLVPRIAQFGEVQREVPETKMVPSYPTITVTLLTAGSQTVMQSTNAHPSNGLLCTFSLKMTAAAVGTTTVRVVSTVPNNNSEASQSIQVNVVDPRTEVAPKF